MAKKVRGGGHQHHKKRRPVAASRSGATSSSASPSVGGRSIDRRISLILVAIVAVVLLGTFIAITR